MCKYPILSSSVCKCKTAAAHSIEPPPLLYGLEIKREIGKESFTHE